MLFSRPAAALVKPHVAELSLPDPDYEHTVALWGVAAQPGEFAADEALPVVWTALRMVRPKGSLQQPDYAAGGSLQISYALPADAKRRLGPADQEAVITGFDARPVSDNRACYLDAMREVLMLAAIDYMRPADRVTWRLDTQDYSQRIWAERLGLRADPAEIRADADMVAYRGTVKAIRAAAQCSSRLKLPSIRFKIG